METIYTLRELKQFISNLSDEQLNQPLQLINDDSGTATPIYPSVTEEDYYYNCDDHDDGGTMAELREIHEGEDDFMEANYLIGCKKGTVLFFENQ
jgi:hypothetical protein